MHCLSRIIDKMFQRMKCRIDVDINVTLRRSLGAVKISLACIEVSHTISSIE